MNFNKVVLAGHLTRDVELRHTQGGAAVAKFGIAINRRWTQDGEKKESVCYVDLTAWGKSAEILAQYAKKGSSILVEGRLEFSSWDGEDGKKRSKLEVVVEQFQFGSRDQGASDDPAPSPARPKKRQSPADAEYGDIPF